MTSPASGSTVAGTVPVRASVSIVGSLVVAGVQFKLDGVNLGAEDTSAPYSISWNTTTASNGSHTLIAVARDLLGLQYTSNSVSVTVFNDSTPPTVSITAPANGATVSGTISVSADASDNVGVAGVQFLLDGAALGAEDTAAPYSVALDTTRVANGSHTLAATARDAAGNRATSLAVTVTVSNAVRFEETDSSVTLTSGWASDASKSWSGGTAAVSTAPGAQATFTFTGTSVNWIGGRGPWSGIARVSVDGAFVAEVDTYSSEEIRVPMFTVNGLTNASHTLTIEVTGQMNAQATSNYVVVDAFDVPGPAVSRLQETDPDVTYSAGWTQGDTGKPWSAGAAVSATASGSQATFAFSGTSVSWIGARGPQTGIADVFLDGALVAEVDTYSPAEQIQAALFTKTGLADANHTLTIEATGRMNAASTSPLVVVDAFEVTSSGIQIQGTDPAITYGPGWIQDNRDKAYSQGSSAESNTVGAQATFSFTGTGVRWIGARGPQTGIARVFLDGAFVEDIDTYALTEGPQHIDFTATGLAAATHTLTIEVAGRNPASTDFWILIDAFDVVP